MVKSKLPPRTGSSLEAVEIHRLSFSGYDIVKTFDRAYDMAIRFDKVHFRVKLGR